MLEVVEHKQNRHVAQVAPQLVDRGQAGLFAKTEASRDGFEDESRVAQRGQIDEDGALCEVSLNRLCHCQRQTGFADAGRTDQGEQARLLTVIKKARADDGGVVIASEEDGGRRG
jgi:hypothetical protein